MLLGRLRLILLLLAVPLLVAGGLALVAGLHQSAGENLRNRLLAQNNLSPIELDWLAANRAAALATWPSARLKDDLAQIALHRAELADLTTQAGRDMLKAMLATQSANLAQQPANPFGWARLAYARAVLFGPSALVALPLEKSVQTGPYEPDLMVSRSVLLHATRPHWTPYLQAVANNQWQLAWRWQVTRFALTAAALDGGWLDELFALYATDPIEGTMKAAELARVEQSVYWSRGQQPPPRPPWRP